MVASPLFRSCGHQLQNANLPTWPGQVFFWGARWLATSLRNAAPASQAHPAFPHATTVEVGGFATRVHYPVYAIDDSSAVEVVEGRIRIVSTGRYEAYNQPLDRTGNKSDH
jgi:hypothetical protein